MSEPRTLFVVLKDYAEPAGTPSDVMGVAWSWETAIQLAEQDFWRWGEKRQEAIKRTIPEYFQALTLSPSTGAATRWRGLSPSPVEELDALDALMESELAFEVQVDDDWIASIDGVDFSYRIIRAILIVGFEGLVAP